MLFPYLPFPSEVTSLNVVLYHSSGFLFCFTTYVYNLNNMLFSYCLFLTLYQWTQTALIFLWLAFWGLILCFGDSSRLIDLTVHFLKIELHNLFTQSTVDGNLHCFCLFVFVLYWQFHKHSCINHLTCKNNGFFRVYSKEWSCWVIRSEHL